MATRGPRSIREVLEALPPNYGVWRNNLSVFLGDELCSLWGINTKIGPDGRPPDTTELARAKVIWHLRTLILGLSDGGVRQSAAIEFNVTPHAPLREIRTIGSRVEWGLNQSPPLCASRETADRHMKDIVLPQFAQDLLAHGNKPPQPSPGDLEAIIAEFRVGYSAPLLPTSDSLSTTTVSPQKPLSGRWLLPSGVIGAVAVLAVVIFVATQSKTPAQSINNPSASSGATLSPQPASKFYSIEIVTDRSRFKFGCEPSDGCDPSASPKPAVDCDSQLLFPRGKLASIPGPADNYTKTWRDWGRKYGGIAIGRTEIMFSIAALEDKTVQILGAELVVNEIPSVEGDVADCANGGGAPQSFLYLELDKRTARYVYLPPGGSLNDEVVKPFLINVKPNEPEVVFITAKTRLCSCAWYLNLFIKVGTENSTFRIDDGGKPFVTPAFPSKDKIGDVYSRGVSDTWCKEPC